MRPKRYTRQANDKPWLSIYNNTRQAKYFRPVSRVILDLWDYRPVSRVIYDKLACSTVSNACLVWGERLPTCEPCHRWPVRLPACESCHLVWQTSLLDRVKCMSSLRGEITGLWVVSSLTCEITDLWVVPWLTCVSPRPWPVYHRESLYICASPRPWPVCHRESPYNGVLTIWICKMTKWCSKFEL
jgi:hypothetical protein